MSTPRKTALILAEHGSAWAPWVERLREQGEEVFIVLQHAEVTFAIAEDQEQVDKLLSVKDRLPSLRHIIFREPPFNNKFIAGR